ncbi:MAG: hypothetical protein Q8L00_05940, partial [Deltaproteobacteria bacterium]|nr:hypothetical protein [Deltaproteobacteria bacterium]
TGKMLRRFTGVMSMNALKNVKNFLVMKKCGPTLPKKVEYGVSGTAFSTKATLQKYWQPPILHEG